MLKEASRAAKTWLITKLFVLASYLSAIQHPLAGMLEAFASQAAVKGERGQLGLGTILAAFVVVIAAFVVVIVVDRFDQSLGDPESSQLNNSSNSVIEGFADMTSLIGPLLLVAIGIVIISLIRRVQG